MINLEEFDSEEFYGGFVKTKSSNKVHKEPKGDKKSHARKSWGETKEGE